MLVGQGKRLASQASASHRGVPRGKSAQTLQGRDLRSAGDVRSDHRFLQIAGRPHGVESRTFGAGHGHTPPPLGLPGCDPLVTDDPCGVHGQPAAGSDDDGYWQAGLTIGCHAVAELRTVQAHGCPSGDGGTRREPKPLFHDALLGEVAVYYRGDITTG